MFDLHEAKKLCHSVGIMKLKHLGNNKNGDQRYYGFKKAEEVHVILNDGYSRAVITQYSNWTRSYTLAIARSLETGELVLF